MSRKSNEQSLKEVLAQLKDKYKLEGKLDEVSIKNGWEDAMGKMIAQHTKDVYLKGKTLIVTLDSSVVRNELLYQRDDILRNVNEQMGKVVAEKVVLR